jgi:hypothetical protein
LTLTFGTYPMISLKEARDLLIDAERALKAGINPADHKKSLKQAERSDSVNSLEVEARAYLCGKSPPGVLFWT